MGLAPGTSIGHYDVTALIGEGGMGLRHNHLFLTRILLNLNSEPVNRIDATRPRAWQKGCSPETMARTLPFIEDRFAGVPGHLTPVGVSQQTLRRVRERLLDSETPPKARACSPRSQTL